MKNVLLFMLLGGSTLSVAQVPTRPDSLPQPPATPVLRDTLKPQSAPKAATDTLPAQPAAQTKPDSTPAPKAADSTQPAGARSQSPAASGARPAAGGGMDSFFGGSAPKPAVIPGTATDTSPKGSAKIAGIVLDSASGKPVEYASVALISTTSNKPIDGTVCDDKGRFVINKVTTGDFRLLVSFVGYKNRIVSNVKIDRKSDDINVGIIRLGSDVRTLKEVQVVGQTSLVEEKVDRMVYNAEKDITNKGGDATDVMRKVPMLSVDLDGNVSLRGSSNVRVLINNKPSTIVASSVADALKQIPADMIKSVEVITSPSAKYDAEGSAGIINIVTKKNTLQGFTLNVDSGVGNRGGNLGLNGNLRTGKMGFSLSGFGRANYNIHGNYRNEQTTFGSTNTVTNIQTADTRSNGVFGQYTLGWDYDISKHSSITASVRYGARNNYSYQDNLKTVTTQTLVPTPSGSTRNVDVKDVSGTVDVNVDYTRTFEKPQQELSVSSQYSLNNRTNNYIADLLNGVSTASIASRLRNDNNSYNQESTVQFDYQTPIRTNQQIEFGGKGIFRQVESKYRYLGAVGESGAYVDTRPNNALNYDQNVAAGYVSYTYATKNKYTIKAGARYEHTTINADTLTNRTDRATSRLAIPNYGNLVPSINISKTLKGGKTIKLAYNRRLQRPGIQFLNPNVTQSNPTQISKGNPNLSPELTDNIEFSTSTYVKSVFITAALFARVTNNSIESIRDTSRQSSTSDITVPVQPGVITTSYQNIGKQQAYGTNVFINATLFSKWQIGGGFDAYYAYLTNNGSIPAYNASNSGFVVSGRLFTNLTLKNGWGVQGFAFIRGRQVQLQGYQGGFAFYSLGIKKDIADKRGSIGLAGENFFNFPFTVKTELQSSLFKQSSSTSFYNAGIRVNFSYKFGKLSFDQPQRQKKSVNNDDVKGGEGGGDAGGQQQAAPAGGAPRRPRG